jgi:hypothetical protein
MMGVSLITEESKMPDYFDKVFKKASDWMFGEDTGVSVGEGARDLRQHRNRIDEVNRQLDNTAPQDTKNTQKIFED